MFNQRTVSAMITSMHLSRKRTRVDAGAKMASVDLRKVPRECQQRERKAGACKVRNALGYCPSSSSL
jgi:hypothetical protein